MVEQGSTPYNTQENRKNDWFALCCFQSDELWFLNIFSLTKVSIFSTGD